ncbi:17396_t:CDS:2 [Entrophospora sp. SA101]|nr:17396_t:CDS:2 [Entrophospora sp. SA101]
MQLQRSLTAIYVNTINTFLKVRKHLLDFQITKSKNKFHSEDVSNKNNFTQKINKLQMPVRPNYSAPKLPIVLCHGLFGFDKLGPDAIPYLQIHYWGGVQEALKKLGAKVVTTKVPRTGCIRARALALHRILESTLHGFELNLLAHSMVEFMEATSAHRPSLQGSVFWMAPEVVKQTAYTSKVDIWSLGCLIVEMFTGDHPFPEFNQMQAMFKIGSESCAPEIPPDLSNDAKS